MTNLSEKVAICPLLNFPFSEIVVRGSRNGKIIEYFTKEEEKFKKGVEILPKIRIRRIRTEDIDRIKQFPAAGLLGLSEYYFSRINSRTFIIEFLGKDDNDSREIQEKIGKILLSIRLYTLISVSCNLVWFVEKDWVNGIVILDSPQLEFESILFSNASIKFDELEAIAEKLGKIDEIDFDKRKSFRIACERFNRVFEKKREDDIIIDSMIAFEALFVRKEVAGSSKNEKIANGCADLLGKNSQEKDEISLFLRKAWQIRNSIVHGSEFNVPIQIGKKKYDIHVFTQRLVKYLSESIIKKLCARA